MNLLPVGLNIIMSDNNRQRNERPDDMTGKGHDRQGNDKAPGEEASQDLEDVVSNTQRGKNKVDGDPSQQSDRPIEQEWIFFEWELAMGLTLGVYEAELLAVSR